MPVESRCFGIVLMIVVDACKDFQPVLESAEMVTDCAEKKFGEQGFLRERSAIN